ncbi:MAG: DUF6285 domain-containing protein [Caulobacterales bacterium]|jgi:hypothetical protein
MYENPSTEAMLGAVSTFLRGTCLPALEGRDAFLARVAANVVDIARRELLLGPEALKTEHVLLSDLVGERDASLDQLRLSMAVGLRSGAFDVSTPGLLAAFERIAADRVRIEQPTYASLNRTTATEPTQSVDVAPQDDAKPF